jgi:hypothetical protein
MSMWCHTYWHCKRRTSKFLKMSSMLVCSLNNFFCFISMQIIKHLHNTKYFWEAFHKCCPTFIWVWSLQCWLLKISSQQFFNSIIVVEIGEYFAHTQCAFGKHLTNIILVSFQFHFWSWEWCWKVLSNKHNKTRTIKEFCYCQVGN